LRRTPEPLALESEIPILGIMKCLQTLLLLVPLLVTCLSAQDWPGWRGPSGNGHAPAGALPPLTFSPTENVLWKTPIPGRGHGSPTIVGDTIYLSSANDKKGSQNVLAVNRNTGAIVWQSTIHEAGASDQIHAKNTYASGSVVSDGKRLFVSFHNRARITVHALSFAGKRIWDKDIGAFNQKYPFGYAASPLVVGDLVVFQKDAEQDSQLTAFACATGEVRWKTDRENNSSYPSPALIRNRDSAAIWCYGNNTVNAYDPTSGKLLLEAKAGPKHVAGTMVGGNGLVYGSGGYPESITFAVNAKTGKVAWENNQKCYEQSMLLHKGYLYGVNDNGIAHCWDAKSGELQWNERTKGPVSASPVLIGDRLYCFNELGTCFVIQATPEKLPYSPPANLATTASPPPRLLGAGYTPVLRNGMTELARKHFIALASRSTCDECNELKRWY